MVQVCMVLDSAAEFVMGRVCYGPSLSWGPRDVPESVERFRVISAHNHFGP